MQLTLGVLKKKLKYDLKHDVEELDLPQATTASRILNDRSPDVTLLREEGLRTMAEEIGVPSLILQFEKAPTRAGSREGGLPSRRWPASLCRHAVRVPGLQCGEHPHRTLKEFEKEKYLFTRTTPQKRPGTAQKTGIEADANRCYNFLLHLGTAPPQLLLRRGIFYLRKSSGSLAMACVNSSHGSRDQRPLARDVCDHW